MIPHVVRALEWVGPSTPDSRRVRSPFSATWTATLDLLDREIWALGAPHHVPWVLQIDVPAHAIRLDGQLRADARPVRSPAVRIAFDSRHGPLTYGCDRYRGWQDNVRAIALSLEALRKVDRYGVAGAGEQYRGWTAIEATPAPMAPDVAVGLLAEWSGLTRTDVRINPTSALRLAARRAHPDITHDDGDTMARLNAARDLLERNR